MLTRRAFAAGAALLATRPALAADIRVTPDGAVRTLAQALQMARPGDRIRLGRGTFDEKLTVTTPDLLIEGEGPATIITHGAAAGLLDAAGQPWGTFRSATLTLAAPRITLANLTVRNHFDYPGDGLSGRVKGAQAVALAVAIEGVGAHIHDCRIEGYQDTLLVRGNSHVQRCHISGGVDFIFGEAAALFEDCAIVTRFVPGAPGSGFVAAPSTPATQAAGLLFHHCRLEAERGVPPASAWLGRPWRAGGNMSLLPAAAYLQCRLGDHIHPEGWTSMGFTGPDGERRQLLPQQARLFEWNSSGPGAGPASATRRMLTDAAAAALLADPAFIAFRQRRGRPQQTRTENGGS